MADTSKTREGILADYDERKQLYEDFRAASELLLRELIRSEGVRVHWVGSRLKERDNLSGKLSKVGKEYTQLTDVTDIVGIRVITWLEDEVDRIGQLIEREFDVDRSRSIDKRKVLDPDRFGYLSLHYICKLSPSRAVLGEYQRYSDLFCEIQVRSILQHAWAEIEHDLGYKAGGTIPAPIRRRFSRLAGLLEIADVEFTRLRSELNKYAKTVQTAISISPAAVGLDDVSLGAFIQMDRLNRDLDERMAAYVGATLRPSQRVGNLVEQLRYVGLNTIEDVGKELKDHGALVQRQWEARVKDSSELSLSREIGLFHLFQVLLVLQGGLGRLRLAFAKFNIGSPGENDEQTAHITEVVSRLANAT